MPLLAAEERAAAGLALGAALLQIPWRVHGVCLAGDIEYYASQQQTLVQSFCSQYAEGDLRPGMLSLAGMHQKLGTTVTFKLERLLHGTTAIQHIVLGQLLACSSS